MLNARLDEIRRQPNAPFLFAGAHTGALVRTRDAFTIAAMVKDGGVQEGWAAILQEILRVERHGFVAAELERAKKDMLRLYDRAVKQYDTADSRAFAEELVRNFLTEEEAGGPKAELALAEKLLPTYPLGELNALAKSLAVGSQVVTISGPPTRPGRPRAR